jgi:hypothetical protein
MRSLPDAMMSILSSDLSMVTTAAFLYDVRVERMFWYTIGPAGSELTGSKMMTDAFE